MNIKQKLKWIDELIEIENHYYVDAVNTAPREEIERQAFHIRILEDEKRNLEIKLLIQKKCSTNKTEVINV